MRGWLGSIVQVDGIFKTECRADAAAPSRVENTKHAESDIAVKCFQKVPGGLDGLGVRTRPPKACGKKEGVGG